MNIFKRFMKFRQLEKDLEEAGQTISELKRERDSWFARYDEEKNQKWEIKRDYNELSKLVREQAEADEIYASMKIIANRFTNKPKADDKQWTDLQNDALRRLQSIGLQGQQGLSQQLSGGIFGSLGGAIGSLGGWPYGRLI